MTIVPLFWIFEMADVGDAVHVHFGRVFEKFVHEHRAFGRSLDGEFHIMRKLGVGINNLHRASAENETGPNQNRIA